MSDSHGPDQPDIDEMGEWDQSQRPAHPRRRLGSMISVRFTPGEVTEVRAAAARRGLTVSEFLRRVALAAANEESAPAQTYNRVAYGYPSGITSGSTVSFGLVVQELQPLAP